MLDLPPDPLRSAESRLMIVRRVVRFSVSQRTLLTPRTMADLARVKQMQPVANVWWAVAELVHVGGYK